MRPTGPQHPPHLLPLCHSIAPWDRQTAPWRLWAHSADPARDQEASPPRLGRAEWALRPDLPWVLRVHFWVPLRRMCPLPGGSAGHAWRERALSRPDHSVSRFWGSCALSTGAACAGESCSPGQSPGTEHLGPRPHRPPFLAPPQWAPHQVWELCAALTKPGHSPSPRAGWETPPGPPGLCLLFYGDALGLRGHAGPGVLTLGDCSRVTRSWSSPPSHPPPDACAPRTSLLPHTQGSTPPEGTPSPVPAQTTSLSAGICQPDSAEL